MRLLLDTHVLLWWLEGARLTEEVVDAVGDASNEVCLSAATVWELSIKRALGKVTMPAGLVPWCRDEGFGLLAIHAHHGEVAGSLPSHHTDPFDRMLIAQAHIDTFVIATRDRRFTDYDVPILIA